VAVTGQIGLYARNEPVRAVRWTGENLATCQQLAAMGDPAARYVRQRPGPHGEFLKISIQGSESAPEAEWTLPLHGRFVLEQGELKLCAGDEFERDFQPV
jgi:hypothetical protein